MSPRPLRPRPLRPRPLRPRPCTRRLTLLAAAVSLLLFGFLLAPATLRAHGGGVPRVTGAQAGLYRVYVWTNPAAPRTGDSLHITIGLTQPAGDGLETPITDASVRVEVESPNQEAATVIEATPGASAGGVYYEADTLLDVAGEWQVMVVVDGAQGFGEFPAGVTVAPARFRVPWAPIAGVGALLLAIILVTIGVRRRSSRQGVRPEGTTNARRVTQ